MKERVKKNSRIIVAGFFLLGICLIMVSADQLKAVASWQLCAAIAGIMAGGLIIVHGANSAFTSPFRSLHHSDPFKKDDRLADMLPQDRFLQPSVINLDALYELSKGSTGFIKEMIGIFIEQSSVDIRRIDAAIHEGDFETIHHLSHRMKGSITFIGLKDLSLPLRRMETYGGERRGMDDIRLEFAKVKAISQIAVKELQDVMIQLAA